MDPSKPQKQYERTNNEVDIILNRISNLSNPKNVINLGNGLTTFEKSIFISASLFRYVTDDRYLVFGMLQYFLNFMND